MKTLMQQVHATHLITETENGNYCWTCTSVSGVATPFPCPTFDRAEELDAIAPLEVDLEIKEARDAVQDVHPVRADQR